jgi:hypothetical protein
MIFSWEQMVASLITNPWPGLKLSKSKQRHRKVPEEIRSLLAGS